MVKSTMEGTREVSPWPFPSGQYTTSHYDASMAFFLVADGWDWQGIMDVICYWHRKHGEPIRAEYPRYDLTIGKAFAMVKPGAGQLRKEPKGAWRHGYTRDQILGSIIETPRTPKQIAEVTGIVIGTVYVALGRLRKEDQVIRDHHTYLCAPTAVPWFLQNIPEAIDEFSAEEMEDQYEEWVASGGLNTVEENIEAVEEAITGLDETIEAPEMYSQPPVARYKAIPPNFYELDSVEEPIVGSDEPTGLVYPDGTVFICGPRPPQELPEPDWTGYPEPIVGVVSYCEPYAVIRARNDEREVKDKIESLERRRAGRKQNRERGVPSIAQMKRDARPRKLIERREREEERKRQWLKEHRTT
jgi:hypothetical protein